ncbi:hypothetical protein EIKCOROL_00898 [Eikenella corrodens ATCC 23834]|uniref:Uncharacterized protein n=1 Tax=Eikenella corrodens ATCC 23834 TaxID=546274 RepID=C0DU67_EIKCO|nr:hypothetical protein EIKCOROL_00898 [Eikenella corrodens ATCC 23834]
MQQAEKGYLKLFSGSLLIPNHRIFDYINSNKKYFWQLSPSSIIRKKFRAHCPYANGRREKCL